MCPTHLKKQMFKGTPVPLLSPISISLDRHRHWPVLRIDEGPPATPERYSLLLRLTLQSHQATLTEAELAGWSARIIERLEKQLNAQIRM